MERGVSVGMISLAVIIILIAAVAYFVPWDMHVPGFVATSTSASYRNSVTTANGISFKYPDSYGLATTPAQVLVESYIPPCAAGFTYCLYQNDHRYDGTNFETAGLRIEGRADLKTERLCINTPPEGFSASTKPANTYAAGDYATTLFANVGDAGAGHYASGSLYRLFIRRTNSCTEFETRIGESQFANYPAGAISQFTNADRARVETELKALLSTVSIGAASERVTFPTNPVN